MTRCQEQSHSPGSCDTLLPNSGFRELYSLLARLRRPDCPEPEAHALGLRLTWKGSAPQDEGVVAVSRDCHSESVSAQLHADGVLVMAEACTSADVLALRNLAANPERRFRRFGFDTQTCPFCGAHLDYGTCDFGLGHCQPCGGLLSWPLDQITADRAEDELRVDVQRELEDENRQE